MAKADDALNLAGKILEAQKEVARLSDLQKELRSLMSQWNAMFVEEGSQQQPLPNFPESGEASASLVQQIVLVLETDAGKYMDAETIQTRIPGANLTSVRSALARLAKDGKVERADRGLYYIEAKENSTEPS